MSPISGTYRRAGAMEPREQAESDCRDLDRSLKKWLPKVWHINRILFENPETGYMETLASGLWASLLREGGFSVSIPFQGMGTSFYAVSGKGSPRFALLAEYDALPGIGHGCGHNLSGSMSILAALALEGESEGEVVVIGTPAEESGGSKVLFSERGVFDGIDLAAMIHCGNETSIPFRSLAIDAIEYSFSGPNAQDALRFFLHCTDMLRDNPPGDISLHGIVRPVESSSQHQEGQAAAQMYIRAPERDTLEAAAERVWICARGASLATGSVFVGKKFETSFRNMVPSLPAEKVLEELFRLEGEKPSMLESFKGSSDIGDVSHKCPAIHPFMAITDSPVPLHSSKFARATVTSRARSRLFSGARVLARLGRMVLRDEGFRDSLRDAFSGSSRKAGDHK